MMNYNQEGVPKNNSEGVPGEKEDDPEEVPVNDMAGEMQE